MCLLTFLFFCCCCIVGIGQWPPKTDAKIAALYELDTNPAIRRNVCMLMGRLNSQKLNTSPELSKFITLHSWKMNSSFILNQSSILTRITNYHLTFTATNYTVEAGQKQLIDFLYFQSTQEYRKRTIVFLETAMKIIGSTRSYPLFKKIVECYTMFKLGVPSSTSPDIISNFQEAMSKTYDGPMGIPRIIVSKLDVITPEYEEKGDSNVVNGEPTTLQVTLTRVHAENFMKQKISMATKQGIPPQIGKKTIHATFNVSYLFLYSLPHNR